MSDPLHASPESVAGTLAAPAPPPLTAGRGPSTAPSATVAEAVSEAKKQGLRPKAVKEIANQTEPYLPADLIGGSVPYVAGSEEEAVWNAAAQACGTERVHFVYTIDANRVWYLAIPSASLASNPNSWCPLAAALPNGSEYWDKETVYLYEQEGVAAALKWDNETGRMQVYSGPSRAILPRVQSMEAANFVTLNPDRIKPVPWIARSLNQESLSRQTVKWLFLSGLFVLALALTVWLGAHGWALMQKPDLAKAQEETANATMNLMLEASKVVSSDTDRHLFRVQELLTSLNDVGGTLVKYEVTEDGKIVWEALVPPALGGNTLNQFNAKPLSRADDGRLRIQGTK